MMIMCRNLIMTSLFSYCYFGMLATESFEKISDCIYLEMNWQGLSLNLKKYCILMIGNMQWPLYYHGFNVITLDLNTFIRVSVIYAFRSRAKLGVNQQLFSAIVRPQLMRSIVSYYFMFKTVASE